MNILKYCKIKSQNYIYKFGILKYVNKILYKIKALNMISNFENF